MAARALADLITIVRSGGGLDIDGALYPTIDLVELVRNAAEDSTIILRGMEKRSSDDLLTLARNGGRKVILVLR